MDNEIIKLKPEVNVKLITDTIWVLLETNWQSVFNKQIFVNELTAKLLPVIEEKKQ